MVHFLQLPLRGLQIAFCAIVLGLSASLSKGQIFGHTPASTNFNAFNGAWGLLIAFVGLGAAFVESFPSLIMLGLDGLTTLFYLAGSITYAVKLGVHSCSPQDNGKDIAASANFYTQNNPIINGGAYQQGGQGFVDGQINFAGRCRMAQADDAFLFFALACFAASMVADLLGSRGGSRTRSNV